jgi:hypothetical protein
MNIVMDLGTYSIDQLSIGGIGLRVAELAEALAHHYSVQIYAPNSCDPIHTGNAEVCIKPESWYGILQNADVVMFFDMADCNRLEDAIASDAKIVSEITPPIEQLEYPRFRKEPNAEKIYKDILSVYARQLIVSEHFICRSEIERVTLIANLCLAGRLSPSTLFISRCLEQLISLIPIGYSDYSAMTADVSATDIAEDIVWTGGLWEFYAPEILVEAIALLRNNGVERKAKFLYAKKDKDNAKMINQLEKDIKKYGLETQITLMNEPIRHDCRNPIIKGARVLTCVANPGIENDTCVRLRVRDSRLYGIPLIIDPYGSTARELSKDGLAIVLDEASSSCLATALSKLGNCSDKKVRKAQYTYSHSISSFTRWLEVNGEKKSEHDC